jgi:hypothetical protein
MKNTIINNSIRTLLTCILFLIVLVTKAQLSHDDSIRLRSGQDFSNFKNRTHYYLPSSQIAIEHNDRVFSADTSKTNMYFKHIAIADTFFKNKQYDSAQLHYEIAINANNNKGRIKDRYSLACCYAIHNQNNFAFTQLFIIAEVGKYIDVQKILNENHFVNLRKDKKWSTLISIVENNPTKLDQIAIESFKKR